MSFEAYIENATKITGKTPEQLKDELDKTGLYSYEMKASTLVSYLKNKYNLGRGHCMGIWAYWKMKGWVADPKNKK